MPRITKLLTAIEVARLADRPGRHAVGDGLYLMVGPKHAPEACSWAYRYMIGGKARTMGLGSYPTTKLATARTLVAELQKQRLLGNDPLTVKKAAEADQRASDARAITFKKAAESYIAGHKAGWRNAKHADQWSSTLKTYAYPFIGLLSVQSIDTAHVTKILEQDSGDKTLWTDKPETAARLRGRIEAVLDWAKVRGHRDGENPARWKGHLDQALPARAKVRRVKHHAAHSVDGLAKFMEALRAQDGTAAQALEFAILTAARTGEVLGVRWDEIDLAARMWTVPAERMKAGREHRVPLSDRAIAILQTFVPGPEVQDARAYVFPSRAVGRPLSNMAFLMLLRRMKREDVTAHGFRSTFRDWVSAETNFSSEAAEMALAHSVGDKVEAAYRRGDLFERRRAMMQAWAAFCAAPAGGNVTPLERGAA